MTTTNTKRDGRQLVRMLATALLFAHSSASRANENLGGSTLFKSVVSHCHEVALAGWKHPTRTVMKKAKVDLVGLQLCNGDKYPVFTVRFDYDPMGNTDSFFGPLFAKTAEANGFWPLAFVDLTTNEIIWIESKPGVREIKMNYEEYSP